MKNEYNCLSCWENSKRRCSYGSIIVRQPSEIIEVAKRKRGSEIAASHGKHGAKKFAFGSVTARLIEHSPVPVLVMK
jgi:nucleotide-binding universal stress UspA family protein